MIDEKKLIEEIKKKYPPMINGFGMEINTFTDKMFDIINSQPKVGEWIPCSERLPECNGEYQVTYEWLDFRFIKNAQYKQLKTKGKWHTKEEVIAWRSLPEPYKGE